MQGPEQSHDCEEGMITCDFHWWHVEPIFLLTPAARVWERLVGLQQWQYWEIRIESTTKCMFVLAGWVWWVMISYPKAKTRLPPRSFSSCTSRTLSRGPSSCLTRTIPPGLLVHPFLPLVPELYALLSTYSHIGNRSIPSIPSTLRSHRKSVVVPIGTTLVQS